MNEYDNKTSSSKGLVSCMTVKLGLKTIWMLAKS